MIIYGWTTRHKTIRTQEFHCPQCRRVEHGDLKSANRWFTLYFIPIIPLGSRGEFVECVSCAGTFHAEVLEHVPSAPDDAPAPRARPKPRLDERNPFMPVRDVAPLGTQVSSPPRTSSAAVASLLFGILAGVISLAALLALPFSLAAIITGHLGLSAVKREPERITGRSSAIAGLVLGYGSVLLALTVSAFGLGGGGKRNVGEDSVARAKLEDAERLVNGSSAGHAFGNTEEARRMSGELATELEAFDKQMFAGEEKREDVANRYKTWCELRDDRCAFIVNVPEYRRFSDQAEMLLDLKAWTIVQEIAADKLKRGDQVAIGLRGAILYGSVLTGTIGTDIYATKSKKELLPFFRTDDAASTRSTRVESLEPEPRATKPKRSTPSEVAVVDPPAAKVTPAPISVKQVPKASTPIATAAPTASRFGQPSTGAFAGPVGSAAPSTVNPFAPSPANMSGPNPFAPSPGVPSQAKRPDVASSSAPRVDPSGPVVGSRPLSSERTNPRPAMPTDGGVASSVRTLPTPAATPRPATSRPVESVPASSRPASQVEPKPTNREPVATSADVEAALADLKPENERRVRRYAAERLATAAAPLGPRAEVTKALLALAAGSDSQGAEAAVEALAVWGDADSAKQLMAGLSRRGSFSLRRAVYQTVAKSGGSEGIDALIGELDEFSSSSAATEALKSVAAEAEPKLLARLTTGDTERRRAVVDALGTLGTERSLPALRELAERKGDILGTKARFAITRIESRTKK